MRISDWSSDVCSSDLNTDPGRTTMTASRPTGCSRRSRLALAIGAAVAFSTAGAALAQEAEGSTAPDVASTAAGATDLDAVIVTANKRVENVREVAAAISVIGEQQLENMGANSLTDYADLVPGMQVQDSGSPGMTSISIRGVAALSSGATVATYIDAVPVGESGDYQAATTFPIDPLPSELALIDVTQRPPG